MRASERKSDDCEHVQGSLLLDALKKAKDASTDFQDDGSFPTYQVDPLIKQGFTSSNPPETASRLQIHTDVE